MSVIDKEREKYARLLLFSTKRTASKRFDFPASFSPTIIVNFFKGISIYWKLRKFSI